jgi:hypothetical protein
VPRDSCDTVKAGLSESQSPEDANIHPLERCLKLALPTVPPGRGENKLVHHSDAGRQHTSFRFTPHPLEFGIDASVGTVSDALDNTPTESMTGLRKTQLIKP